MRTRVLVLSHRSKNDIVVLVASVFDIPSARPLGITRVGWRKLRVPRRGFPSGQAFLVAV
jgi:hypothetical protein